MHAQIARAVLARPEEFTAQNLCNVMWSFSKLDVLNEPLLALGVQYGLRHMATFAPQSVSNLAWSFAKLGHNPGNRWACTGTVHTCAGVLVCWCAAWWRGLEACLPCLGRLAGWRRREGPWLPSARNAVEARLLVEQMGRSCRAAWCCPDPAHRLAACPFTRPHRPRFLDEVAAALERNVRAYTPQHLSNTLWSFATLGRQHPGMLKVVAAGGWHPPCRAVCARATWFSPPARQAPRRLSVPTHLPCGAAAAAPLSELTTPPSPAAAAQSSSTASLAPTWWPPSPVSTSPTASGLVA
jgi:hypothetical protein